MNTDADEKEIRELVRKWMAATKTGDLPTVLSLMTDDVIFLTPGQPPMTKDAFAILSREQSKPDAPKIDGTSEIQEIKIVGEWAFMWANLRVVVQPPHNAKPVVRQGSTLSILRKQNGMWRLARDANMLTMVKEI
jgi:uncharacterized protein (TIGR02246 family)